MVPDGRACRVAERGDEVDVLHGCLTLRPPPDHRRHRHPPGVTLTGGHRNDVTQLILLIDVIQPIHGVVGKPCNRPQWRYADDGYDRDKYRRQVRACGITPVIACRDVERRLRCGHGPLAGRAHLRLVGRFPPTPCPRRAASRRPSALLSPDCSIVCLRKLILN
ncbi:transposase [Lentzea kristufekii]|uniref:transposase n=1 Tax=Lentzea kristufekii TaxID=3095430 RepID=UPI00387309DB